MSDDSPTGARPARARRVMGAADATKVHFAREQRAVLTHAERRLWQALRGRALGVKFRRQHPIEDFVLDFYCEECQLAIEIDGPTHAERPGYDLWRDERLQRRGIITARVTPERVISSLPALVNDLRALCRRRQQVGQTNQGVS